MVGLGETRNEVLQMMDDMRSADVDFLTIGQYLQPTRKHHPVERFVPPEEFAEYAAIGAAKGFLLVSSSPLTRSSITPGTTSPASRRHGPRASRGPARAPEPLLRFSCYLALQGEICPR